MYSRHKQLKHGRLRVTFHSVIWVKLLRNSFRRTKGSDEKVDWIYILQTNTHGQSIWTVCKWLGSCHCLLNYLDKITQKWISYEPTEGTKRLIGRYFTDSETWTVFKESSKMVQVRLRVSGEGSMKEVWEGPKAERLLISRLRGYSDWLIWSKLIWVV